MNWADETVASMVSRRVAMSGISKVEMMAAWLAYC